jgi:hypothetical protein
MGGGMSPAEIKSAARQLITGAHQSGVPLFLFGSVAVLLRAERCSDLRIDTSRTYKDVDCVSFSPNQERLHEWMTSLGWQRSERVFVATEGARLIYRSPRQPFFIDVFFDELAFCQRVRLKRKQIGETLSVGDLFLSKVQRVELRRFDFDDLAMLLTCDAPEFIAPKGAARKRILTALSSNWGFYHSATANLVAMQSLLDAGQFDEQFSSRDPVHKLKTTIQTILLDLRRCPKSLGWRLRSLVGEAIPWYSVVESVDEPF